MIGRLIRTYILAIKYWAQGDKWAEALEYASVITGRWK